MKLIHHSFPKTARVWIHGDVDSASTVWVALHGYGQDVKRFAEVLAVLEDENTAVIIPEGPHRFYSSGFSGEVGASWMTKEDRDNDILDYINYLSGISDRFNLSNKRLNVLGFSQGAATASRWVSKSKISIHHLVLWAGIIPPDLDLSIDIPILREIRTTLVVGNDDEFIQESSLGKMKEIMDDYGLKYNFISFEGKHRLNREVLNALKIS